MAVPSPIFSKRYQRIFQLGNQHRWDVISPLCILVLGAIGILFIYSAQYYTGGNLWKKQIFWLIVGGTLYVTISHINYKLFMEKALWIYLLGILGLFLVLSPMGVKIYGAQRWIDLGLMKVQPTEGAKIATLIMVASILARSKIGSVQDSLMTLATVGVVFFLPIFLIFLQPDLGSTLVFPPMVFALLYVSRLSQRFFITAFALFLLLVGLVTADMFRYYHYFQENNLDLRADAGAYQDRSWLPLHDYQRNRILGFVAPDLVDPRGTGISWNRNQSLIAVGSGGLTGKGHLEGTQAKLGYLPQSVAHNDFIFAVIAEESGFLGSTFVLGLLGLLIANGFRIAGLARDRFGMLLAVGVSVLFLVHTFINVGMTIGITPITGLPLPFLSYGGSFVLSCCILQGLVQSVYRFRRDFS
jgi:rod shape determining protein RodA